MLVYSGAKMNRKILRRFTAIVLLYNLSLINIAQAGFLDQLQSKFTGGDRDRDQEISTAEEENENKNLFERLYAWSLPREIDIEEPRIESEPEIKKEVKVVKIYTVRATAYSSTPDQTDSTPFITASGARVRDGIIAANFLPFGTQIRIPEIYGEKIFVVEDRMNKRYWHNVDIWFPERDLAKTFGSKRVIIEIIEES